MPVPTGHQHRSTCYTDGSTEGARAVVTVKTEATVCNSVKIGSVDALISMCRNRIGPLVIGEQEEDIGSFSLYIARYQQH